MLCVMTCDANNRSSLLYKIIIGKKGGPLSIIRIFGRQTSACDQYLTSKI
jgi:hypothetical protein